MTDAQYHALVDAIEDCAIFMLDLNGRIPTARPNPESAEPSDRLA